ncbi:MAG TPA: PAS domain S-box protein [Anaerolineales bacterium]|nr:PAS domain S-box protein [Anaerolineales bacterium]
MSDPVRILIVEDTEADADLARREIRKMIKDCEFQCVDTREDYLEALEAFRPDLILSDYHLPHFDGMTALRLASERSPFTPLIIWTGSLSEDIAVDCMKAGANNYVIKENIVRLGPAVIHALEERRLLLEHKQAEEALEKSEKRFRALIENGLDSISLLAPDGALLWESPAVFRILDYAPDQFLGQDIFKLIHPDDLDWTRNLFAKIVQEPGSRQRGIFRLRHSSGVWRWVEAVVTNMIEEPSVQAIVVNYRDISERKQAEMERQALLEMMQGLANTNDLQEFLKLIHLSIGKVIYAENFFVVLYDENSGLFEEIYSVDQYDPPEPPSKLEKSITSYVFRTGEPLLVTDVTFEEMTAKGEVELVGTDSASWLGAPLKTSGRTIGVIAVQDYENPNRYSEQDKEFLASIAAQIALAIERKQAEEALQASEKRFRALIENGSDVIAMVQADGTITYVSPGITEFLGYSVGQYVGTNAFAFIHPEDTERAKGLLAEVLQSPGITVTTLVREQHQDGSWRWMEGTVTNLLDEPGVQALVANFHDVTERKRAEEALREAETKYRTLVEQLPAVTYLDIVDDSIKSGEFIVSYISPQVEHLLGYPAEDFDADPGLWTRLVHPDDREQLLIRNIEHYQTHGFFSEEYRMITRKGREIWVRDEAIVVQGKDGQQLFSQGVVFDITQRKQAEEELRASEERFVQLANNIQEVFWMTDVESGREIYMSPAAAEIWGRPLEYLRNEPDAFIQNVLTDDLALVQEALEKETNGENVELEYRITRPDGSVRWIWDRAFPIFDDTGRVKRIAGVSADITERKKAEEESRRRAEETSALLATSLALTNLDLKATLETIGNSAKTLFGGDGCRIFLMEQDGASLRCVLALQDNAAAFTGLRINVGEGVTGQVAASGQAEIVNEMQNDPRGVQISGTPEEEEAIMFAPLKERDQTIGVLSIRRAGTEHPFQHDDLELLEAFAAMAASAVSKARLFEETQRRLAELEALYENGLAVGRLLKPSEIGDRIIETFARYLSWHHVAIRLKRPDSDQLELIAFNQPGLSDQERAAVEHRLNSMVSNVDQGLSGWVIQTGEVVRTGDVHSHPQYVDSQEGIRSGLYMPLRIGDRIIGSISVESEIANAFTAQDERLLATLSNQAAIAFENARLYQSAQQELMERKRLQEQLDREHAQLKTLFETIPDPIWLKDPEGQYLACNPILEEWIDLPEVQILGKTDYNLLDEQLAEHFKAKDQEAIQRNTPVMYQEWVTYPNKQPRLMETVRTPMYDDQGSLIGVLGISHDITAMHNTEQELRESQELYRLLVETSPDGIGIFGLDGTIIFANQQLADLFGMENSSNCIGANFLSFIAPGEQPEMMKLTEASMQDGVMLEEYWMARKDGSRFYGEARSSLSLDKAGQPRWIIGQIRDITESKTAQETIQEERQRFLDLFENTPVAIWLEDFSRVMAWMEQLKIQGVRDLKDYFTRNPEQLKFAIELIRVLSVNQAAVKMNGAESKGHLLEEFHQLVRGEVAPNVMLHELDMLWSGKTSFEFEVTNRKLDGTLTTGILHVFIPTNNGRPDYGRVIIASTDITERVNTEKALQASEMHYRELADSITDVFFEMDSSLHYIYWNKASEALTGITAKDAIGKSMRDVFGETVEQARIEKIYEDVLSSQQSKTFETSLTLDNREHIFEINAYPSTRGVSVVAKDVTDRKRSETIMQKRFELMEYSARHSLDELMQKTIDEVCQLTASAIGFLHFVGADQVTLSMQTWSTGALQQFNMPISAGTHQPIDQAGVWADAVRERRSIIHNDYASLPKRKSLPEGHAQIIREMVIPIIRNEKTVAVLGLGNRAKVYTRRDLEIAERFADYAWDITERKQMEVALADERNLLAKRVEERAADLIRANTNLARALRVKDEFLANMSHELRTPLNAILGLSESLGEQIAGPLNEKQQKYITTISESGRHLLSLINDILDLAKIEAGQITLDINRVDIQSVCEASLRMIKQLAQKKRQDVTLKIDDDIGLIWADERRLKQMIVNLLSNAVKFTPEDGKIGLEVHGNEAENEVMITVWDNGIGMREADLSRLFQPFVQLDSGLARETTGTGLGLALVAQMVRLHGGSVRVASHPEQGSHFTIVLPWEPALAADPATKMKVTGKFRAVKPDPNNRPTILLIEDTKEVIMMIRDYLELAGYQVATAQDGVEGITQAQLIHPDLILMDVMMPRMDGLEATRRLRSEPEFAQTPIIALTALAMPSDRERCLSAGMNDYMSKPVNLKELVKTIQRFLVKDEEADS